MGSADRLEDGAAVTWALGVLGGGSAEVVKVRPWAATWRLQDGDRTAYLKVPGPAGRYELPLMAALAQAAPDQVPAVLGTDHGLGALLLADAGVLVREAGRDLDEIWLGVVTGFARLQRRAERLVPALLAAGVPDDRPGAVPDVLSDLRSRYRLPAASARLPDAWAEDLALIGATAVLPSVQHGDLHDGNAGLGADGRIRFFDLGDASVAHPFTTLFVAEPVIRDQGGDDALVELLRDAYLDAFTDVAPLPELRRVLSAVLRISPLSRAAAWDRALRSAPDDHPWGEPVQELFADMLDES